MTSVHFLPTIEPHAPPSSNAVDLLRPWLALLPALLPSDGLEAAVSRTRGGLDVCATSMRSLSSFSRASRAESSSKPPRPHRSSASAPPLLSPLPPRGVACDALSSTGVATGVMSSPSCRLYRLSAPSSSPGKLDTLDREVVLEKRSCSSIELGEPEPTDELDPFVVASLILLPCCCCESDAPGCPAEVRDTSR